MTIWRIRIAWWVPKTANTHTHTHKQTECIIIIAFPLQNWLHERTSILCHTYKACLVINTADVISEKFQNCGQHLESGSQRINL